MSLDGQHISGNPLGLERYVVVRWNAINYTGRKSGCQVLAPRPLKGLHVSGNLRKTQRAVKLWRTVVPYKYSTANFGLSNSGLPSLKGTTCG